jgi:predicted Ser/Thr protein kinase
MYVFKKNAAGTYYSGTTAAITHITKSTSIVTPDGKEMTISAYEKLAKKPVNASVNKFQKTNYVTASTVPGASSVPVYKKVATGTHWTVNTNGKPVGQVSQFSLVKNKNGTVKKLGEFLKTVTKKPSLTGYTLTNFKYGLSNVYKKNEDYYMKTHENKLIKLTPYSLITNSQGKNISVQNLKKPSDGYNPTKFKISNMNVYKKNEDYYVKKSSGDYMKLSNYSILTTAQGNYKSLANLKKEAVTSAVPLGWTNTGKLSNNGKKVYKSGVHLAVLKNGKMSKVFKGKAKLEKQMTVAAVMAPVSGAAAPVTTPGGSTPTNYYTQTGQQVFIKNGKAVYTASPASSIWIELSNTAKLKHKNTKKVKTVSNVAKLSAPASASVAAPVAVTAVSLVPIVRPGPDHVKATEAVYVNSVKKVAEKLKELHEATGSSNTKNLNNYKAAKGNMGFVHMNRANTITYKTTSVQGFQGGAGWKSSLEKPQFIFKKRNVHLHYTQYLAHQQLLFVYGKNVNSFENVRMSDIIDTKWLVAQDKYIRSLSSRQLFTMFGYSYNGDSWAHAYLDGRFSFPLFKSAVNSLGGQYFAFFFQARDFYKINTGNIDKDYKEVLNRVTTESDEKNIKYIMNMFINELNEIIRKAPAVTRTFIVFRGQKDDRYMSGMVGNTYTTERFCSASVDGHVSKDRFSGGHTLQRITLLKGSKCLLMFGATKFEDELEILLPRGSTYQIIKKRTNVKSNTTQNLLKPYSYPASIQNLVDIVLIGTVQDAPSVAQVPVTVVPKTNVQLMQNLVKPATVTGLIGKGGYGAVYQASNSALGNLAIKIQKKSNNSNAEIKALKKLTGTGIAPNYYNNYVIKANNNTAKLIPRGVAAGNNVSIMMSKMIRGNPLKKWYTGAPIPQNIKNKVKNAVSKMHNKGVIHGDLHRNNILIGNNGKAYVIDFGKSLVTNKSFKTANEANNHLKKLTGKTKTSHTKVSWYSNNKRTHFLNGNFLKRMT